MLEKLLINKAINNMAHKEQHKKNKEKKRSEKRNQKQQMIRLFGKTRYYLSYWFGSWILYIWNHRRYWEPEYHKFYTTEKTLLRYYEDLKEKYTDVYYELVYDKHKCRIGYMLYGKQKKAAERPQQPSNVIYFDKIKTKLAR